MVNVFIFWPFLVKKLAANWYFKMAASTLASGVDFSNLLIPRVKPWMIQSFLTFDSMDRAHSLESC